jgi:hypothetical protein
MEARIFLAADFANVDSSGKLNVLGAFNRVILQEFPGVHRSMYLVIRLTTELGEFNQERILKIVLFDADAHEKWSTSDMPFTVPVPKGGRTADVNVIIEVRDIEFQAPGRYEFRVFVNQDSKGVIPIDAEYVEKPVEE